MNSPYWKGNEAAPVLFRIFFWAHHWMLLTLLWYTGRRRVGDGRERNFVFIYKCWKSVFWAKWLHKAYSSRTNLTSVRFCRTSNSHYDIANPGNQLVSHNHLCWTCHFWIVTFELWCLFTWFPKYCLHCFLTLYSGILFPQAVQCDGRQPTSRMSGVSQALPSGATFCKHLPYECMKEWISLIHIYYCILLCKLSCTYVCILFGRIHLGYKS